MLDEIVGRAKADPAFADVHRKFAATGVKNWLTEGEKALHYAVGAYAPGGGKVVEIGSFEGGSACFLAAGVKARGHGRLTCIDPFLGGPTWLGMAPHQRTLEAFRRGTAECGVTDWIDARIADSAAISAIWPAEPIDAVFIDGDHSFMGALKDFECWGPKVKTGGLVMIDDADDPCLPELLEMINFVRTLKSVDYIGTVDGIAVLKKADVSPWAMLDELGKALNGRGIYRPWDWSHLHGTGLPPHYLKSKEWDDPWLSEAYQLCFLARCGPGAYGYTPASNPADRAFLRALSKDRGDGAVTEIGGTSEKIRSMLKQPQTKYRVILCKAEEAKTYASRLLPGGVLIARQAEKGNDALSLATRKILIAAGLEGCGYGDDVHWGVWQPHHLASDAILDYAVAGSV